MKNLLYIGNKLLSKGKTTTTIDSLSLLLCQLGYHITSVSNKKNKVFRIIDMIYSVIKYKRKVDYILIDTYSTLNFYYTFIISQLCRVFNIKYIPILHGGQLPNRLKKSPWLSKCIFNNSYINIAPSNYIKSSFKTFGFNNVNVIPNTIEIKNYPFKLREIDNIKLLWVRSFSSIYNPILALIVVKKLKKVNANVSLTMVGPEGDGSLEEAKQFALKNNIEVTFTGRLNKEDWIDLSKKHNMFINTTHIDNTPVSVIEAMALGLPIVSTNVGGLPYLIANKKEGILVKSNDVDAMTKAILYLKDNPMTTKNIILSARKKAESFDWEVVKEKWISIFK